MDADKPARAKLANGSYFLVSCADGEWIDCASPGSLEVRLAVTVSSGVRSDRSGGSGCSDVCEASFSITTRGVGTNCLRMDVAPGSWREFGRIPDTSAVTMGFAGNDGCKDTLANTGAEARGCCVVVMGVTTSK